ncbi:MAG TPA: dTDP-4-dehydrorhamnose reductase [Bacteroidales bacterium]|jgi:dTDP-4-dehydrorhamnose reductase|nr:dTDP-4-dehydrorhamnose reductase [Bacteroidales bacterium]
MKKVLITGSNGQLGSALRFESGKFSRFNCNFIGIDDLDLTNLEKVRRFFSENYFDYIINCAAYTAVDLAENHKDSAFTVNGKIPEILASECLKGTRLIHMSTDYVYDGSKNVPHREDDVPNPSSVYAQSKLAGEEALLNNPLCIVIRTSWLYSEFGKNFMMTMIRLSGERKEINVVYDQTGTPTYAGDLANALFTLLSYSEQNSFKSGIYNYSNEGVCSWYDFAIEIMNATGSDCHIKPVRTREYPLPASRPAYSVMDKSKIKRNFDIKIPHWRESLQTAIKNLERQ